MLDGFYTVRFGTPNGAGGGVASFTSNEIVGGDSAYTYVGNFTMQGSTIHAILQISPHFPGVPTVFGPSSTAFNLKIIGTASGNQIIAEGEADIAPGVKLKVNLQRIR